LTDKELIQVCHNDRVSEHLEVKRTETSYKEDTISVTLKIESLSTSSDAIHVAETRFRDKRYDEITQLNTSDVHESQLL
jgi:hypothetical protein